MTKRLTRLRRVFWSSGDQALASVSNLLLSILVARAAPTEAFGAFAIAFTVYQFALGISRAAVGEPLLIRASSPQSGAMDLGRAAGAGALVGTLAGLICVLLGVLSPEHASIYVSMAIVMPIAMMVDSARYWEFAHARPRGAFMIDLIWLVAQLSTYLSLVVSSLNGAEIVILSWGVGALCALAAICWRRRTWPRALAGARWIWSNRDLSFRFSAEYLAISGVQQSVVYFSVIFAGLTASAAIRGGQVVLGPLSVLSMGIAVVALPTLASIARAGDRKKILTVSAAISALLLAATVCYTAVALLIPQSIGTSLLGESWNSGALLVPLIAIQLAVGNVAYGATAGLRALEKAKLSLRLRWVTAPLVVVAVIIGAASYGATGALLAASIGGFIQALAWWTAYLLASRGMSASGSDGKGTNNDPH